MKHRDQIAATVMLVALLAFGSLPAIASTPIRGVQIVNRTGWCARVTLYQRARSNQPWRMLDTPRGHPRFVAPNGVWDSLFLPLEQLKVRTEIIHGVACTGPRVEDLSVVTTSAADHPYPRAILEFGASKFDLYYK